jgi:hypothetical protein
MTFEKAPPRRCSAIVAVYDGVTKMIGLGRFTMATLISGDFLGGPSAARARVAMFCGACPHPPIGRLMNASEYLAAFGFAALIALSANVGATPADEERCRVVAMAAAAEIKAATSEPLSDQVLLAARDGAFRGCMAASTPPVAKERAFGPAQPEAARADGPAVADDGAREQGAKSRTGGLFDFLTRESKRTSGHKRLQRRGKF